MTDRRSVARSARTLALLAAVGVAVYAVVAQRSEIRDALTQLGPAAIAISVVTGLVGLVAGCLSWRALLTDMGEPLPWRVTTYVFFVGQLAKYLPGGIWSVVAQMELGRDSGADRRRTGATGVVALGVMFTTGLAVAVICLPFASTEALGRAAWLFVFLPIGLVLLHPRVLTALVNRVLRLMHRSPLEQPLSGPGVGRAVGWALVTWICFGAHIYVLCEPLADSGHRLPLLTLGGYALAWTVGFLTVIAPAGAGAREAMLVVALSPALTTAEATAVALLSRVILSIGDLMWGGVALLLRPTAPRATSGTTPEMPRSADFM